MPGPRPGAHLALLLGLTLATPALSATPPEHPMILVEHHGLPIVHLNLQFRSGPALDPPGKSGLTMLTHRMLLRGTTARGRAELEEAIEDLGTELYTTTQLNSVGLSAAVLPRHLDTFIALLGELITQPRFAPEEIEKVKREMLAETDSARDDDSTLSRMWFRRMLWRGHPAGRGAAGSATTLANITVEDVRAHHRRVYGRENLVVGASGDITRAQLEAGLAPWLVRLGAGEPTRWRLPDPPERRGHHVALIDKADRSQVQLMMGHTSMDAADPDVYALDIATTAFGGTFTARLMQEVRVKRGWSYGAYARHSVERAGGAMMLTAAPEVGDAVDTLTLMLSEYERFVREGLTDEEIDFARDYLVNGFPFRVETATGRMALQVRAEVLGRPPDFFKTYTARLKALSNDAVRDAVARRLDPSAMMVVMVCSAPALRDAVAHIPGVRTVTVHPFASEPEPYAADHGLETP